MVENRSIMIKSIKLLFGAHGKTDSLNFEPGAVTVFVGPNNSGKSLILREIEGFCENGKTQNQLMLEDIDFELDEDDKFITQIESLKIKPKPNEALEEGTLKYGKFNSTKGLLNFKQKRANLINWKNNDKQKYCRFYVRMFTSRLGGKERFNLISDQENSDLKAHPNSILIALFQDNTKRREVRDLVFKAFSKYFVIDPTNMRQLKIMLSDHPPQSDAEEKGWDTPSVEFHKKAKHITEFSDGVQAFVGMLMSVYVGEETIMLVDEPEAFLHPSLSSVLGNKLSGIMSKRDGNLLASTHSPNFLMGCIQSGKKLNIIRLTYNKEQFPTARLLSPEKVNELFRDPLLRSTGIIQALFYNSVIVCEADTDRAFYHEINERLLSSGEERGINNCLFVNAQNKQTIWQIIKPLREMGIPAAAIVDIDLVKDGGKECAKVLNAAFVPEGLQETFKSLRAKIFGLFKGTGKDMKKDGGVEILSEPDREVCIKFISDLADYGVFLVPNGEVESWLKELGVLSGHGGSWLIKIFEKLGSDPEDPKYVKPHENDVWHFLDSIRAWVSNENRKGIPNQN